MPYRIPPAQSLSTDEQRDLFREQRDTANDGLAAIYAEIGGETPSTTPEEAVTAITALKTP